MTGVALAVLLASPMLVALVTAVTVYVRAYRREAAGR